MSETRTRNLAAVVGASAAALLLMIIPQEESGRTVKATVAPDGTASVEHVRGRQYLKAYLDSVGVATICDGITKGVRLGQTRTEAECAALLEEDLVRHASGVMACTPNLAGHPYQTAAAVSLAYNIGVGGYCRSSVDRHFDAGRWRQGCDAILMWNRGGGRVIRGLTLRRQRERAICLRGLS